MSTVVIAEKPSVARDIASALGVKGRKQGYFEGNEWLITWAIGHLVALAQPDQINPGWKKWTKASLPMLPEKWPLVVLPNTKAQFSVIVALLQRQDATSVICATDAGREGELIFRYIYAEAACHLPVERLWISSLTPAAIRKGFASLKSSRFYDPLADSAMARSRADWLVGMNLSRSYTLASGDLLSVGRVQTPTLAMVVQREEEIVNFKPEAYSEISAQFSVPVSRESYGGLYFIPNEKSYPHNQKNFSYVPSLSRLHLEAKALTLIKNRALSGSSQVAACRQREFKLASPLLYDLTQLQKDANVVFGLSAQDTLAAAQSLYEKEKLISYPRSDCSYIDESTAATLGPVISELLRHYAAELAQQKPASALSAPQVDTAKVVEHHGIVAIAFTRKTLPKEQEQVFDLICRRMLMALLPPYLSSMTTVITTISSATNETDYYQSLASQLIDLGWKTVDLRQRKIGKGENKELLPACLAPRLGLEVSKASISNKSTKAPPYLSEARLLAGMETAGDSLGEKELAAALRQRGLGTPATRAQIIEVLIKRQYLQRQGKILRPTERGIQLISLVDAEVKSPKMTARWEAALQKIAEGNESLDNFMREISGYVGNLVEKIVRGKHSPEQKLPTETAAEAQKATHENLLSAAPHKTSLHEVLHRRFHLSSFRPLQEEICEQLIQGKSALVVMPTGAGKSLCYQLPGLVRPGPVIIISPLISLMEDQVSKLRQLGLAATSIHSGCHREEARDSCRAYLAGQLKYLFIAPERLALPGFLQLLARVQPALLAIDEAHCISQWGHDFRADYRLLGERLSCFRGVPLIALTATANLLVQEDIIEQLGLVGACTSFIGGFRRTNLAIEVVSLASKERFAALAQLLSDPAHLPAIVYVATRKDADSYAAQLSRRYRARPYHAGMTPAARSQVQTAFLHDELEVIVATVAFGMGIDKASVRAVVHLALPSTMAGYYQEIGRAGRDGKVAKALLLYSLEDQRMLLFLYQKNYPEVKDLEAIWRKIPARGLSMESISGNDDEARDLANGIQKLLVHGGLLLDGEKFLIPQKSDWQKSYNQQRKLRMQQLQQMFSYAEGSNLCRMVAVIRYFGDEQDSATGCGLCDICRPEDSYYKKTREANDQDLSLLRSLISILGRKAQWSEGALFKLLSELYGLSREDFTAYLGCLSSQGILISQVAAFNKKGHIIHYKLLTLVKNPPVLRGEGLQLNIARRLSRNEPPPAHATTMGRKGQTRARRNENEGARD